MTFKLINNLSAIREFKVFSWKKYFVLNKLSNKLKSIPKISPFKKGLIWCNSKYFSCVWVFRYLILGNQILSCCDKKFIMIWATKNNEVVWIAGISITFSTFAKIIKCKIIMENKSSANKNNWITIFRVELYNSSTTIQCHPYFSIVINCYSIWKPILFEFRIFV